VGRAPAYTAVGNLTTMPQSASLANGYTAQYDAWNRRVELKYGTTTVATYRYDGATRRVTKWVGSNTTNFHYSDRWQILEERLYPPRQKSKFRSINGWRRMGPCRV
jgi:hypothetical protein